MQEPKRILPSNARVKFAYDVAGGQYSVGQLAERHDLSYQTARRWRASEWCALICNSLHRAALEDARRVFKANSGRAVQNLVTIANLAKDIGEAMQICMERLRDPEANGHVTFEFKGFPTVLEANRLLLEACHLVGVPVPKDGEVSDATYQTRFLADEAGGVGTTAVASRPDPTVSEFPTSEGEARHAGNGDEVG